MEGLAADLLAKPPKDFYFANRYCYKQIDFFFFFFDEVKRKNRADMRRFARSEKGHVMVQEKDKERELE